MQKYGFRLPNYYLLLIIIIYIIFLASAELLEKQVLINRRKYLLDILETFCSAIKEKDVFDKKTLVAGCIQRGFF